jgi:ankyrin repeat protein
MAKTLIDNGADKDIRNAMGLDVLHIAAQGDQPMSLYFFKTLHMDLTSVDNRGSTPIHWACFSSSEVALLYLLGWLDH